MSDTTLTHVVFSTIYPKWEIVVPIADAFTFWDSIGRMQRANFDALDKLKQDHERNIARRDSGDVTAIKGDFYEVTYERDREALWDASPSIELTHVIYTEPDGRQYRTFAKSYTTWDFEHLIPRLVRIGVGAYGTSGPENPALEGLQPVQRYVQGSWTWGYNWDTRNRDVYPDDDFKTDPKWTSDNASV